VTPATTPEVVVAVVIVLAPPRILPIMLAIPVPGLPDEVEVVLFAEVIVLAPPRMLPMMLPIPVPGLLEDVKKVVDGLDELADMMEELVD